MAGMPSGGLLRGGIKKVPKHPSKMPVVREPKRSAIPAGGSTRDYGKMGGGFGPPAPSMFTPGMSGNLGPLTTPPPSRGDGSAFGP